MSSSQPFITSSPLAAAPGYNERRKSRFTFKHLGQLGLSSTTCPLRVVALIDLDAFYAQCEGVRLNIADDQPLAVQQWQGLIAINYPARKFGLSRHIDINEAKKLCPQLIVQHVATWREGDTKWAYHEDAFKHIATDKVSLDPYRLESRRILTAIKEFLPATLQRVEKASVDEMFLDLSAHVHSILLQRYPELQGPAPYDDLSENLPCPPTTVLDWNTDALVDLDANETEDDDPDWDDIVMLIGSEIVRDVRKFIYTRLKYTCSAGVAQNKMLSKLGSAHRKPNQQTIIRNRAIQHFLADFKFTKIRNLGGKLGDEIVAKFGTDSVKDMLEVSHNQLKLRLGDETGSWVYQIIRGIDFSEVNSRTQIKSMLSAKSFRPTINTYEQAVRWLRIFAADIFSRLVEEGVVENTRRPKTINLHHRQGGNTKSRQAPIPKGRAITEEVLFELARNLLTQIIAEGKAWPCGNLSLSVGGFEDAISGNRGIGSFLIKVEEAKAMEPTINTSAPSQNTSDVSQAQSGKRRRLDNGAIQRFLVKTEQSFDDQERHSSTPDLSVEEGPRHNTASRSTEDLERDRMSIGDKGSEGPRVPLPDAGDLPSALRDPSRLHQQAITTFICGQCGKAIPADGREEHEDWHFATELQAQEHHGGNSMSKPILTRPSSTDNEKHKSNGKHHGSKIGAANGPKKPTSSSSAGKIHDGKVEKGQRRLAFG